MNDNPKSRNLVGISGWASGLGFFVPAVIGFTLDIFVKENEYGSLSPFYGSAMILLFCGLELTALVTGIIGWRRGEWVKGIWGIYLCFMGGGGTVFGYWMGEWDSKKMEYLNAVVSRVLHKDPEFPAMEMVLIPAGEFRMGEEPKVNVEERKGDHSNFQPLHTVSMVPSPRHFGKNSEGLTVKITKPFYLAATEVTQAQYEAVMGKNPSRFKYKNLPVENVPWENAVEFCKKLSARENKTYRLPTEAEWEYACRAGTKTKYSFGTSEKDLGNYAWVDGNSDKKTHPVGKKKPNAWGLYDMYGNVWEHCSDWLGLYPTGTVTDPTGPKTGRFPDRVLRGGSWRKGVGVWEKPKPNASGQVWDGRSIRGAPQDHEELQGNVGFRVALTVQVESAEATGDKKLKNSVEVETPEATVAKKIMNSINDMEMTLIPAGEFQMGTDWKLAPATYKKDLSLDFQKYGDEGPVHTVTITKPFYMSATEVTQAQYGAVMGKNPSKFKGKDLPVEQVNRNDALEFCKKLSAKENKTYRLPTEAEWEYACRAGTKTMYSFGDSRKDLGDYAWYGDNSDKKTHPVGKKKPNAWGLFDMHGNVWEWCSDMKGRYRWAPATDPTGARDIEIFVIRGGGFYNTVAWRRKGQSINSCRSALRRSIKPGVRTPTVNSIMRQWGHACTECGRVEGDAHRTEYGVGFRVVLSVQVESPEATGDK